MYCAQLEKMSEVLLNRRLRRGKVLLLNNARTYTAKRKQNTLEELGIEPAPHPLYSPDLASSVYHVSLPLQSFFARTKFTNR